jgi:hypothetical protein
MNLGRKSWAVVAWLLLLWFSLPQRFGPRWTGVSRTYPVLCLHASTDIWYESWSLHRVLSWSSCFLYSYLLLRSTMTNCGRSHKVYGNGNDWLIDEFNFVSTVLIVCSYHHFKRNITKFKAEFTKLKLWKWGLLFCHLNSVYNKRLNLHLTHKKWTRMHERGGQQQIRSLIQ